MKRISAAIVLLVFLCFFTASCTSPSELYGAWYVDEGNTRNAIQFSENVDGKDVFVWVIYDIKEDKIQSTNTGYYKISNDLLIFEFGQGADPLQLNFTLEGDKLSISSETAVMTLTKYVLDE